MNDTTTKIETEASAATAKKNWRQLAALIAAPFILLLLFFVTHPFKETLSTRSIDLSKYTTSQRLNFLTAAHSLDGAVIKPNGVFSFNGRVGPRLNAKGFVPAPGYLAGQKQNTSGGGICLVSSTLYQVALLSGLKIVERYPHTNAVRSVAPGLDATVWYGRADLKFKNEYASPVAISCCEDGDKLSISIVSDTMTKLALNTRQPSLRRCQLPCGGISNNIIVEVFLKDNGAERLVSRDRYLISRPAAIVNE